MKKQHAGSKKTSRFSSGRPIILLATALLVALAVLLGSAGTVTAALAPAPTVTGISPDNGRQGQWLEGVQISGTDFGTDQSNVSIRLTNGLDTINGSVWNVGDTSINGEFHIPADVTLGAWDVVVEHNDDHLTGTLPGGFTVNVGASISGRVTHDGSGVPNILVAAISSGSGGDSQITQSTTDGSYTIGGLSPGTRYRVVFWDQSGTYAFEYYNDKGTWTSAAEVQAPSSGIDEDLEDGVTITGTVTDAVTHDPIPNCYVAWSDSTSDLSPSSVPTGPDGTYTLRGLKSGVGYKVSFNVNIPGGSSPLPYTPQWYEGKYNWSEAGIVTAPTANINAQLDTTPAATISGTVTSESGPLGNIYVIAFLGGSSGVQSSMAATAPDGTYTLSSLSPGTHYKVLFYDESSQYAIEYYNDAGTWDTATDVIASETGIDAVLEDGVTINGTVRDAVTHNPIQYCTVAWSDSTLDGLEPPSVQTDTNGVYTLPGLKSGVGYKVSFTPPVPYYPQWYNVQPDWTHANLVTGGSLEIDANLYSNPSPTVTGTSPVSGQAGDTFQITVSGTDFQDGAVARLERTGQTSIDLGVSYENSSTLTNSGFTLPYDTLYGDWNVVVENPDHQQATAPSPFNVTWHSPIVSTIDPNVGNKGSIVHVTLHGQYFHTGAQVNLAASGHHLDATNELVNTDGTEITCDLDLTDAMIGVWQSVVVTNADGHYAFILNGFTVEWPPPVITQVTPTYITNLSPNQIVTVKGNDIRVGCEITLEKGGEIVTGGTTWQEDPEHAGTLMALCNFNNVDKMGATDWNLVLTNNDGKSSSSPNFGLWNPLPIGDHVTPLTGTNDNADFALNTIGNQFGKGVTVQLTKGIQTINANPGTTMRPGQGTINALFNLTGATGGFWNIVITNPGPGGGVSTIPNGFKVLSPNPPNPTVITPNSGINVRSYDVTIDGTGFQNCTVQLTKTGETPIDTDINVIPTQITGNFDLTGVATGQWNVVVKNDDDQTGTIVNGFTVYQQYDVNASVSGGHGSVSPTTQKVNYGDNATINITPESDYEINSITDNGASKNIANPYVITNVIADHSVVVTFNQTPASTSKWYLAEGSTKWGFDTYISLLNPNDMAVNATLHFFTSSSTPLIKTVTLPGNSQTSVNARDYVGNVDFSTEVETDQNKPIAVDRTMMWTGPWSAAPEAHSSVGVTSPGNTWYLAEGSTDWNFECWLLIQNPNSQDATCNVTYMTTTGPQKVTKLVPANTRQTYNVANDIGVKDTSIKVESAVPVIAERSMYRYNRREGAESIGTTAPSNDFYLAEGSTNWGFQTWVLVQNPNNATNNVTVEFSNGVTTSFTMAPETRKTVNVNSLAPKADVATHVHGSLPVVAERSMYWNSYAGEACHDSIGLAAPHKSFSLPDGAVLNGWETWTLIQNPNDKQVTVNVTYLAREGSKALVTFQEVMPAKSRKTLNMADKVSYNCGIKVTCSDPIMVERSMYGYNRALGTNTIGGFSD